MITDVVMICRNDVDVKTSTERVLGQTRTSSRAGLLYDASQNRVSVKVRPPTQVLH